MYITTTATERRKNDEKSNEELDAACTFAALLVPNPCRFSGSRGKTRSGPNLFVETVSFDEHGEEVTAWTAPRDARTEDVVDAHLRAGRTRVPASLPNFAGPPIRAVSLGYEEDDLVGWFSLDLDGGYPLREIGPVLARAFGKHRLVCHSGSGKVGRYRVLGVLNGLLTVRRLQALLNAICAKLGFPPLDGSLEIFPAYRHTRLPGGLGGCRMFDIETGKKIGRGTQKEFLRAVFRAGAIDLEAVAKEMGVDAPGIDTGIPQTRGRFDPWTRRERRRSIPRHLRAIVRRGVTRPGERQKVQRAFVLHCLLEGLSAEEAISRFHAYIDDGKFDESRDVKANGREWFKRQVPRIVLGIYASTRPIGMPDPIPLEGAELHRIRKIAIRVHAEHPEFSVRKVEDFLKSILAIFKGCIAAGLPLARVHSKIWQTAGGTHYARLRAACGIFDARSGYKSLKLVMSRAHLGAQPCEAKAIDWSTSFAFDRDLPAPSYEIARSILVMANDPPPPPSTLPIVVSFPSPSSTKLPRATSIDALSTLPQVSSRRHKAPSRLYVHHLRDPMKMKGSESASKIEILSPDEPPVVSVPIDIDYDAMQAKLEDEIRGAKRRKKEIQRKRREALFGPEVPKKIPEWKRIANWSPPVSEDTGIDEWLAADAEIKREYAREKAEAERDRKAIERKHGVRLSLGHVASRRFHELRAMFGLDPWH